MSAWIFPLRFALDSSAAVSDPATAGAVVLPAWTVFAILIGAAAVGIAFGYWFSHRK